MQQDSAQLQILKVERVTGDAFVNNRKNKLIPSYELEVRGSWQGGSSWRSERAWACCSWFCCRPVGPKLGPTVSGRTCTGSLKSEGAQLSDVKGSFELPYIGDENADEDPQLNFTTTTSGKAETKAKQLLLDHREV